jgi:hypothetical protein
MTGTTPAIVPSNFPVIVPSNLSVVALSKDPFELLQRTWLWREIVPNTHSLLLDEEMVSFEEVRRISNLICSYEQVPVIYNEVLAPTDFCRMSGRCFVNAPYHPGADDQRQTTPLFVSRVLHVGVGWFGTRSRLYLSEKILVGNQADREKGLNFKDTWRRQLEDEAAELNRLLRDWATIGGAQ